MAWYPDAVRKQLTVPNRAAPNNPVLMPRPVRCNLHTAVSNSFSLAWYGAIDGSPTHRNGFFNTTGANGVFSHFYVREDGVVEQMQDTKYRATCDLDGNPDTISVETWDGYKSGFPGYWTNDSDVPPWNAAQRASLIKLVRWIYAAHPTIPRKIATSNLRGSASQGLSWHRLGVPGYSLYTAANGGLMYTTSYKKGCPGNRRISQIPEINRLALTTTTTEDRMATLDADDKKWLTETFASVVSGAVWGGTFGSASDTAGSRLARTVVAAEKAANPSTLLSALIGSSGPTVGVALQDTFYSVQALKGAVGVEVDVDETALAQQTAALIGPLLETAVAEAIESAGVGATPKEIADAVFTRIGGAFTVAEQV